MKNHRRQIDIDAIRRNHKSHGDGTMRSANVMGLCDEVERLRADLAKYGGHTPDCTAAITPRASCSPACRWTDVERVLNQNAG